MYWVSVSYRRATAYGTMLAHVLCHHVTHRQLSKNPLSDHDTLGCQTHVLQVP